MAKKVIVKEQKHGCIWLCGVLLVVCLAVYALAFALIIALGVAVWFLMRGIWRSMVANKPDSKFVQFGMKMTPQTRKILAGIASAIVVIIISGIISAAMPQKEEKSLQVASRPSRPRPRRRMTNRPRKPATRQTRSESTLS